jgi:hypothetical protein
MFPVTQSDSYVGDRSKGSGRCPVCPLKRRRLGIALWRQGRLFAAERYPGLPIQIALPNAKIPRKGDGR